MQFIVGASGEILELFCVLFQFRIRAKHVPHNLRSVKETLMIYTMGVVICVYLGFLFGAVWIDGNDLNEFMNNFQSFIIEQHHFIVGVTAATPTFVLSFVVGFSMTFIIIFTQIEHSFASAEYEVNL